jgi:phage shock protein A
MTLLERVSTLLRANLNDLIGKAEDPEKLARQLVLDMENQLLQVKTQVAIAIADQHLLGRKKADQETEQTQWLRKAELAVAKGQDDLARAALERALSHQRLADGFAEQLADQTSEADSLRAAYARLQSKLTETRNQVELLVVQLRLAALQATAAEGAAQGHAARTMLAVASADTLDERFHTLERNDEIESLLLEIKQRQPRLQSAE